MIFHLHRQAFHRRVETRALWNGPAFHHPVQLEAEIEMKVAGSVFLDDEAKSSGAGGSYIT
jgi:hypothetical protein